MVYRVSKVLKKDMATLRRMFAEAGFKIYTPARRYVRSNSDFIAISKIGNEAVLVRIGVHRIETRRYNKNAHVAAIIKKYRSKATKGNHNIRQRHPLPVLKAGVSWAQFIAETEREDFVRTFKTPPYRW